MMQCPRCGSRSLRIEVVFRGKVACIFQASELDLTEPVFLSSEWNDDSECECSDCNWLGTVAGAREEAL